MTMYVVKVGTNVKTATDSSDGDRFDFYGPFTRPVVEVTRLAAYTPTGYDAVARFVRG